MKVLISGSSGFVGSALVSFLENRGHRMIRLVRPESHNPKTRSAAEAVWNPAFDRIDEKGLEGIEAVVHLAGENIMGRWTAAKKAKIRDSRVRGTHFLSEAVASLPRPPAVFVSASAIGYYGGRGEEILTEESPMGRGFLPPVCQEWEEATEPARRRGIRVVNLRTGIVLSTSGGALAKMLTPFKLGLGGILGNGRQYMSWIALEDELAAIEHAMDTESLKGPVNLTAPHPVTNREFTKTLGRALGRPTLFPMPAFAVRMIFGEMADELFLASARVIPKKLLESGYVFRHTLLESAFREALKPS